MFKFKITLKIMLIISLVLSNHLVFAENSIDSSTKDKIQTVVNADSERLVAIFKDLHMNPELGFMEERTASIIASELGSLGFKTISKIGGTGVVGILKNGQGPTFMFRADMDANAVEENTGLPYASKKRVNNLDGIETAVAHLCGHDAHSTWLLALAKAMVALKKDWQGTLVLLAQPAEEPIEGAQAMLKDGLYTRHSVPIPDYFLTLHTAPVPTGTVLASAGRLNTGSEHIDVTFHGVGGHGSSPHNAKDPVLMAGLAIVQYQSIVSRVVSPTDTGILTIGSVQAGIDNNVIPTDSTLKLKLHFSTPEVHEKMVNSIELMSNAIANSYEVSKENLPTLRHKGYTPAMVNDQGFITNIQSILKKQTYITTVVDNFQVTGSDDAAALVEGIKSVKSAYLMVGTAPPKLYQEAIKKGREFPFTPHEPNYTVDLEAIPLGAKIATAIAIDAMSKK